MMTPTSCKRAVNATAQLDLGQLLPALTQAWPRGTRPASPEAHNWQIRAPLCTPDSRDRAAPIRRYALFSMVLGLAGMLPCVASEVRATSRGPCRPERDAHWNRRLWRSGQVSVLADRLLPEHRDQVRGPDPETPQRRGS